ncbi:MAG TPA: hypothetical protein VFZ31_12835 [Vicinamibacterales bacterium]
MNGETPAPKKRNWLYIIAGVLLVMGMLSVGCVVGTFLLFRQAFEVTQTSEQSALQQMDEIRNRFPGQQPLIQLVDGKPQLVERAAAATPSQPLKTLHVMAFDSDEENLVNFSLPFWLIRMKSGPIRISAYQQGWDDRGLSFDVEEIEKAGPGIIADITREREGRVVIWAE